MFKNKLDKLIGIISHENQTKYYYTKINNFINVKNN